MNEFRIYGPPGCGKTTTLGKLVAEACHNYGSEAVLAASFTRAAARELVSRDLPLDDSRIGTLHALCYRILDRPKLIEKTLLKEWNDMHHHFRLEGGVTLNLDDPYAGDGGATEGDALLQELNRLRGLQVEPEAWPMTVRAFAEAWGDFKEETHTLDFTDLIETALRERTTIPGGASHFFLDEVQDFSPLELALARQWGRDCEAVYLVGDDDQALYAFKGAHAQAFLSPPLPAEQITILEQSYRVPEVIHAKACDWIGEVQARMPKVYWPRDARGELGEVPITVRDPSSIKPYLDDWLGAGKTVAFLASCSFMLDPLKHQLRDWGTPFHNPYRTARGDWNPLHGKSGTVSCGERVLAFRKLVDAGQWWTYRDLYLWAAPLRCDELFAHGAKAQMRRKAEECPTVGVDPAELEVWFKIPEAGERAPLGDLDWLQRSALKTFEKPLAYACAIAEQHGSNALAKTPQIILGTIHSVKGAEADVVVLYPDLSPAGYEEWNQLGEPHDNVRRMFYVGQTRAKESLFWAQSSGMSIEGYL